MIKKQYLMLFMLITVKHAAAMSDEEKVHTLTQALQGCNARLNAIYECDKARSNSSKIKCGRDWLGRANYETPMDIYSACVRSCNTNIEPRTYNNCGPNHNQPCWVKPSSCGFFCKMGCKSDCKTQLHEHQERVSEQQKLPIPECEGVNTDAQTLRLLQKECTHIATQLKQTQEQSSTNPTK